MRESRPNKTRLERPLGVGGSKNQVEVFSADRDFRASANSRERRSQTEVPRSLKNLRYKQRGTTTRDVANAIKLVPRFLDYRCNFVPLSLSRSARSRSLRKLLFVRLSLIKLSRTRIRLQLNLGILYHGWTIC